MISNALTALRIILSPIILYLLIASEFKIALVITIIAVLTDLFDGYLARKLKKTTKLGKFLDPLADKILAIFVLTALLLVDKITIIELVMVSIREIALAFFALIAVIDKKNKISSWKKTALGQWTTVFQFIFIISAFLSIKFLKEALLIITFILSITATVNYVQIYKKQITTLKPQTKELMKFVIALILAVFYKMFYLIFAPLTIYPTAIISKIFYSSTLINNSLIIGDVAFKFIPACIAASAYAMLSILILTTKGINFKKCLKLFIIGAALILGANILRLEFLIFIYKAFSTDLFNTLHLFIWKVLASIYVVVIWVLLTKYYKIREIPVYSTLKELYSKSLFKKKH